MKSRRPSRACPAIAAMVLALGLSSSSSIPSPGTPAEGGWIRVDYGAIVDRRQLTHTGEAVGDVLRKLDGRPAPRPGDRPEDDAAHRVLDPVLEPYAFVLSDALDTVDGAPERPRVEVGWLYSPGTPQPAWAELLRARRYVVESDGAGALRVCLPYPSGETPGEGPAAPARSSEDEAKAAWDAAWPVLRHVVAAERARLEAAGRPRPIDVAVHPYRHLPARTLFDLGVRPFRTRVERTDPPAGVPALDLEALRTVAASGRTLEGARLDPDGTLVWLTSESKRPSSILGHPVSLADVAVAYRAIFHGGAGDPYMSLDRAEAPHAAAVTFAGRLQDTALGLVSLLSDIRFKTLSQGIDIVRGADLREAIRADVPGFKTHVERMAADPTSSSVASQQTRFWFYPDDVSLALSAEGDVFAIRRARLTAASEKVDPTTRRAVGEDPPWTKETVAFVNRHYDALARRFPELGDLDVEVRLLALFTWLRQARADGLPVGDLDALMAVELPAVPTPRRFPQLLVYDAIPVKGGGAVEAFEQLKVGEALERLQPRGTVPMPAMRRWWRALGALDRRLPDHAALAKELEASDPRGASAEEVDRRAHRAERLTMHRLVLSTLDGGSRKAIETRRAAGEDLRAFSIGIGGVDLGMGGALAKAARRGLRVGAAPAGPVATARAVTADASPQPRSEPPTAPLPGHGLDGSPRKRQAAVAGGRIETEVTRFDAGWIERGTWIPAGGKALRFGHVVLGPEGPWASSRRRIDTADGGAPFFERLESGRFLAYRLDRRDAAVTLAEARADLPRETFDGEATAAEAGSTALPDGLALLRLDGTPEPGGSESAAAALRVMGPADRDVRAAIPRAVLQRLVLGREVDADPQRPLPGMTPASGMGGGARTVLVALSPVLARAPWSGPPEPVPGEEDAVRIAAALTAWWAAEPKPPAVAVAIDPVRSPAAWAAASRSPKRAVLWLPEDAFPVTGEALFEALRRECADVPAIDSLDAAKDADVIVLASAESPGALGRRLQRLAADPRLAGKFVAVWSGSGAMRPDLPGRLLREGRWAAIGVGEGGPLKPARAAASIAAWLRRFGGEVPAGRRIEDVAGPFVWHY